VGWFWSVGSKGTGAIHVMLEARRKRKRGPCGGHRSETGSVQALLERRAVAQLGPGREKDVHW
jgi:hypothetical protein